MRASGQFAVHQNHFDLERVLSAVNEQYRDHLKRSGATDFKGKQVCEQYNAIDPHETMIGIEHESLYVKFREFLKGKNIHADSWQGADAFIIRFNQDNMNAAKLSYRDEQELLFQVNQMFKEAAAPVVQSSVRPGGSR